MLLPVLLALSLLAAGAAHDFAPASAAFFALSVASFGALALAFAPAPAWRAARSAYAVPPSSAANTSATTSTPTRFAAARCR